MTGPLCFLQKGLWCHLDKCAYHTYQDILLLMPSVCDPSKEEMLFLFIHKVLLIEMSFKNNVDGKGIFNTFSVLHYFMCALWTALLHWVNTGETITASIAPITTPFFPPVFYLSRKDNPVSLEVGTQNLYGQDKPFETMWVDILFYIAW